MRSTDSVAGLTDEVQVAWMVRVGVLAGLLACLSLACSPPGLNRSPATPDAEDARQLEPGIVRAVDLLNVPGLGPMRRLTPSELPDYQGPELRGACGAVIVQPQTANRLAAAFVGDLAAVSEVVVAMEGPDARKLLGDVKEKPDDCDPVEAVGSDGRVQTYTPGPVLDIGKIGDDTVATQALLTVENEQTHLGTVLIRSGGTVVHGQILSDTPIQYETIKELAELFHEASEDLPA
jgi:hypothetical protein